MSRRPGRRDRGSVENKCPRVKKQLGEAESTKEEIANEKKGMVIESSNELLKTLKTNYNN